MMHESREDLRDRWRSWVRMLIESPPIGEPPMPSPVPSPIPEEMPEPPPVKPPAKVHER